MISTDTRTTQETPAEHGIVDCDLHNNLDSTRDLYPYLSQRWRDHLDEFGARKYQGGDYPRVYRYRPESYPPSGRVGGSDVGLIRRHHLDPEGVAYAVLNPLTPVGQLPNLELDAALATAVNEWQIADWLDEEPRLRASIVIPYEDPPSAVAEIRRRAADRRFVQVLFLGRTAEPLGRRKYWPIFEACAEHGLHVASHAFYNGGQPITGAGWPSYYFEDHLAPAQAMQGQIMSMVVEGVFERYPDLRLISLENGFGWISPLAWRLDRAWERFRREVPHLRRPPSEVIAEHVYLATQPIEEPERPEYFHRLFDRHPALADRLLFSSDYPHWDGDSPSQALPVRLSDELHRRIFSDNGRALYGLS